MCLLSPRLAVVEGATLPAGFSETVVLSGLTQPTAIRFSPDGRVFVAEKSGLIKVFANLSATTPTVFHDLRTNVHNFWDRGLVGLDLHPSFPTIPYVYVLYGYDKDPNNAQVPRWGTPGATSDGCPTPPDHHDGCVASGRLSRLELSSGSNVSTGTEISLGRRVGLNSIPVTRWTRSCLAQTARCTPRQVTGPAYTFADYGQTGNPLNPLGDPPVGIGVLADPAHGGRGRDPYPESTHGSADRPS